MNSLEKEQAFFHLIAKEVNTIVTKRNNVLAITTQKRDNDFATEIDVAVEKRIIEEIKKQFPEDAILAEETSKDTLIPDGRIWIIDPICGTNNLARNIGNFCTNIALADKKKLIASCVIDHSNGDYYWSVGNNEVFINDKKYIPVKRFDTYIEVDFGAMMVAEAPKKEKHNVMLKKLVNETNYYLISLNSSLGFAYVAVGKVDALVNLKTNPWDNCAASFLIQQSGGIVTDLEGNEWHVLSNELLAANTKELHAQLLDLYKNS